MRIDPERLADELVSGSLKVIEHSLKKGFAPLHERLDALERKVAALQPAKSTRKPGGTK